MREGNASRVIIGEYSVGRQARMSPRPTVVLAVIDTHLQAPEPRPVSIGGLGVWGLLSEAVRHAGMDFAIDSGAGVSVVDNVILLWDFATFPKLPPRYCRPGVTQAAAWSLESPLVAHRSYHRLHAITRDARHVFAFRGARSLVPASRFRELSWPNDPIFDRPGTRWADREFLVLINSNKGLGGLRDFDIRDPVKSTRRLASAAVRRTYPLRGKWDVPDLYAERVRLIEQFATEPDFSLYGMGWDRPVPGLSRGDNERVQASWRGAVADKVATLAQYKYALILENTEYPGYVTEKIFDCFAAGTIPVYRGAPDIDELVPPECFVDARKYATPAELSADLRAQTAEQAARHISAAKTFVSSPAYRRFTSVYLVDQLMGSIEAARAGLRDRGASADRPRPFPQD